MRWLLVLVFLSFAVGGCGRRAADSPTESSVATEAAPGRVVSLPKPKMDGDMPLERALAERRSVREFATGDLTPEQLSQLVWAGQGITRWNTGGRTAPSAGALYPVELYVADQRGAWRYVSREHALEQVREGDVRANLAEAAYQQSWIGEASAVFVVTVSEKTVSARYPEQATRFATLEAGHVCQNILLEATALGLGATPVGSLNEAKVATVLGLPKDRYAVYVVPVGTPE